MSQIPNWLPLQENDPLVGHVCPATGHTVEVGVAVGVPDVGLVVVDFVVVISVVLVDEVVVVVGVGEVVVDVVVGLVVVVGAALLPPKADLSPERKPLLAYT